MMFFTPLLVTLFELSVIYFVVSYNSRWCIELAQIQSEPIVYCNTIFFVYLLPITYYRQLMITIYYAPYIFLDFFLYYCTFVFCTHIGTK